MELTNTARCALSANATKAYLGKGEGSPVASLSIYAERILSKKRDISYPRLSIRLSNDERIEIERRAELAGLSLGGYCKSAIFNTPPPRRSRRPVIEKVELSRLLGQAGMVGNNLNQIARQLNQYSAIDLEEVSSALADVAELRTSIMKALGYTDRDSDPQPENAGEQDDY